MTSFRYLAFGAFVFAAAALPLQAQQLFKPTAFLTPGYRGSGGSEYAQWDNFLFPYQDPNLADFSLPSEAVSDPTIAQIIRPDAFISGANNIYSNTGKTGFELVNNTGGTIGVGGELKNLVFQFETLGTAIDLSTVKLNYLDGATVKSVSAVNMISEYRIIIGGFGGFTERVALQWNLTGLGIKDYTITFESLGSSCSFSGAVLDPSTSAYTEVVASARSWDGGGGNSKWSNAANWSGDTLTTVGGNVTIGASAGAAIELDSNRQVGELRLTRPGNFAITPSGGSVLTINTGITANAGGAGHYTISGPVFMGGHNIMDVAAGTNLEISGVIAGAGPEGLNPISGTYAFPAAGVYKAGGGTLLLSGNNTFTGGVSVDEGQLILAGVNAYTGSTAINQGELVVRADALLGSGGAAIPGALGNANDNIVIGLNPSTYGPLSEARLVIEGNYTVARGITLTPGTNPKVLVARNAPGAGATFSGTIGGTTQADKITLRAESASDVLNITGAINLPGVGKVLTKDGAGTVVYSGVNKSYSSDTLVAAGKLEVATGTALGGAGNVTVSSGAQLIVNGSLNGTGTLNVNGGTIGGSGTISRAFALDTGDVLSPGSSAGTLNTVNQTWAGGATLKLEINDADGIGGTWDKVNITGALSLTASAGSKFKLELYSLTPSNGTGLIADFNPNSNYTWQFLTSSNVISGFDANAFQIDTSHFQNTINGTFSVTMGGDSKSLSVQYLAVPEPSSSFLALSGALALLHRRRRPTKQS